MFLTCCDGCIKDTVEATILQKGTDSERHVCPSLMSKSKNIRRCDPVRLFHHFAATKVHLLAKVRMLKHSAKLNKRFWLKHATTVLRRNRCSQKTYTFLGPDICFLLAIEVIVKFLILSSFRSCWDLTIQ